MPLTKLQFKPGVNREATTLSNEGGWYDGNNIRFRSGYPEKIGGWVADSGATSTNTTSPTPSADLGLPTAAVPINQGSTPPSGYKWTTPSFWGVCNNLIAWESLTGYNLLGLGTNLKYYIQNGINGIFYDITPIRTYTGGSFASPQATVASNAFTTTASSGSYTGYVTVTCNVSSHGALTNDFVTISGVASNVDNIPYASLNAEFQLTVIDSNTFSIQVYVSGITLSGTTTGAAVFNFQINSGNAIYTQALGWGAGPWGGTTGTTGIGGWGNPAASSTVGINIRLWSSANYGQNLVINPAGGPIYYWAASVTVSNFYRAQQLSSTNTNQEDSTYYWLTDTCIFTGSIAAGTGGNNSILTVTSIASGILSPINIGAYLSGGSITPNTYTITSQISGTTVGGIGTYYVSSTTLTQSSTTITASVNTCPTLCNLVMVSDTSNFVIAFGCNDPGGYVTSSQTSIDPLLVRWTDQQNILSWYPTLTNQAGSQRLSQGSLIVTAIQTRQEILIFTDTALYNMQYIGPPYVFGFNSMGDNISIISPNCVSVANNTVYWMGYNKFYFYNGTVQTLPCSVRQYLFDNINFQQSEQVFSGTNEAFNEIWWYYVSVNSTNNTVDSYVVYNYLDQTWYYGQMSRSAWLYSPLRFTPMSTTYNGQLIYQENGVDDGTAISTSSGAAYPITSYIQSSDFDIGDGNNFGFVYRLVPDVNFTGSTTNQPAVTMTFLPRQFTGSTYGVTNSPTITSAQNYSNTTKQYIVQQFTPQIYVRARGRQMAFKISSNTLGVAWQSGTNRLDIRPDGRR